MDILKTSLKKSTEFLKKLWFTFEDAIFKDQRKTIIYSVSGLVLVSLLTIFMLLANTKVRRDQINALVFNELPSEKILALDYNKEVKTIKDKQAISVMFAKPKGENYEETLRIIGENEDELNRNVYFYPLVYGVPSVVENYQIDPDKITFIFFEQGEEKNRYVFDSEHDAASSLIPELNRLPMWNTVESKSEEETETSTIASTESTTESSEE